MLGMVGWLSLFFFLLAVSTGNCLSLFIVLLSYTRLGVVILFYFPPCGSFLFFPLVYCPLISSLLLLGFRCIDTIWM